MLSQDHPPMMVHGEEEGFGGGGSALPTVAPGGLADCISSETSGAGAEASGACVSGGGTIGQGSNGGAVGGGDCADVAVAATPSARGMRGSPIGHDWGGRYGTIVLVDDSPYATVCNGHGTLLIPDFQPNHPSAGGDTSLLYVLQTIVRASHCLSHLHHRMMRPLVSDVLMMVEEWKWRHRNSRSFGSGRGTISWTAAARSQLGSHARSGTLHLVSLALPCPPPIAGATAGGSVEVAAAVAPANADPSDPESGITAAAAVTGEAAAAAVRSPRPVFLREVEDRALY
jgi:hypothetical protein